VHATPPYPARSTSEAHLPDSAHMLQGKQGGLGGGALPALCRMAKNASAMCPGRLKVPPATQPYPKPGCLYRLSVILLDAHVPRAPGALPISCRDAVAEDQMAVTLHHPAAFRTGRARPPRRRALITSAATAHMLVQMYASLPCRRLAVRAPGRRQDSTSIPWAHFGVRGQDTCCSCHARLWRGATALPLAPDLGA